MKIYSAVKKLYEGIKGQEEAENPNTSPERLKELSKDWILHKYIAKNPNTSIDVLHHLFHKQGLYNEVMENPAMDLFELEDPNFMKNFIEGDNNSFYFNTMRTLREPNANPRLLKYLAIYGDIENQSDALKHPNMPLDTLHQLYNHPDYNPYRKGAILANPNFPIPKELPDEPRIRAGLGERPNIPEALLRKLHNDPDTLVKAMALKHPNTSSKVLNQELSQAMKNNAPAILRIIANHENTDFNTLQKLAKNKDQNISNIAKQRLKKK